MLNPVSDAAAEPPEAQVIRLDTLPDAMRKLRRMAEEIHATHFATFIIVQRGERRQLVPCLDAHYPGISERSKMMTALLGDRFAKRISGTARPLWWSKSEDQAVFADAHFAERIEVPAGSQSGLALPVAAEHGPEGTIVLTGERLVLNAAALCDIHARCFALFGVIARLGPPTGNSTPAISKRELECLMLTANGLTSDEIADKLGLSVHTANQYLTNTSRKLNAVNRVHAVAKALRLGMFD